MTALLLSLRPLPLLAALMLAGCASLTSPTPGSAPAPKPGATPPSPPLAAVAPARPASAAALPGAPPTPPVAAGSPPPFDTVVKDAKKTEALFAVWRKDEKAWLELKPQDFDTPFFLSPKLFSGIGESSIYGGKMLSSPQLVMFRRIHNAVQLLAINTEQIAKPGTPEARAVAAAISPSLLASTPVASSPHAERKTVLVDANALFLNDMLGIGPVLQRAYRQGYSFDGRNSAITTARGKPDLLVLEVSAHYATASIAVPNGGGPPTPAGAPVPTSPRGLLDARSMFLGIHYSLARLPAQTMTPRVADPRIGHFVSITDDFSNDLARSPRQRYVNRWRLEKKEPAADLSEPVKPITYWLDRNVPLKYREVITAGALEWNKAFEKIGFKGAVEVRQQPDDADWDTLDAGVASIRWMVNREPGFGAIGPSHVDPRSGEILDADIGIESLSSRSLRTLRLSVLGSTSAGGDAGAVQSWAQLMQVAGPPPGDVHGHDSALCQHGDMAAEQLSFGIDLLAARGELDPDGPEARRFVLAYLKDLTMHEVGHTLGLRHNFRASHIYSDAQVSNPEFSRGQAFTGSVMEYAAINLPGPGELATEPFQTTLGPYDYWAIEYAYRPLPVAREVAELARIAARSGEPQLAYGTDEDNYLGIDPDALHFDLGNDPLAFARRRFDIAADLFQRQETRPLKPDEDYGALRRSLGYALRDAGRAAGVLLRQVGGLRTLRDFPNTGRDPIQPVGAVAQRAALALLSQRVLSADSWSISPGLQRRLAPVYFEREEAGAAMPTEFSLAQNLLNLQRALLNRLMGDELARRVLDNEARFGATDQAFRLREMYQVLQADVWSELAARSDINAARRDLQREHLNRLASLVQRPGALSRSDARALVRSQAQALLVQIDRAAVNKALSDSARLHLKDSAQSLRAVLAARMEQTGA